MAVSNVSVTKNALIPGTQSLNEGVRTGYRVGGKILYVMDGGYIAFSTPSGWKVARNTALTDLQKMKYKMKMKSREQSAVIRPIPYLA